VTRQVFAVAFTFDKTAMSFVEAPAPVAIVDQIAQDAARENKRYIVEIYFEDSADNEVRILREVASLAGSHDLQSKAPPQVSSAGSQNGQRQTSRSRSSAMILCIRWRLRFRTMETVSVHQTLLGGFAPSQVSPRTRRVASVNVRSGPQDPDAMVQIVRPIAKEYGLTQMDKKGMFTVARFGQRGYT